MSNLANLLPPILLINQKPNIQIARVDFDNVKQNLCLKSNLKLNNKEIKTNKMLTNIINTNEMTSVPPSTPLPNLPTGAVPTPMVQAKSTSQVQTFKSAGNLERDNVKQFMSLINKIGVQVPPNTSIVIPCPYNQTFKEEPLVVPSLKCADKLGGLSCYVFESTVVDCQIIIENLRDSVRNVELTYRVSNH